MFDSCCTKQDRVRQLFAAATTPEERYQVLLDLGRHQAVLSSDEKTEKSRVHGCQSSTYLKTSYKDGKVYIDIESDALISAGLGQVLTMIYSGETPETILKCPPTCIEDLGIQANLTPGRANGLASILARIRYEALQYLLPPSGQFTRR
jgi:cysteine desulfuration protein SufE